MVIYPTYPHNPHSLAYQPSFILYSEFITILTVDLYLQVLFRFVLCQYYYHYNLDGRIESKLYLWLKLMSEKELNY